MADDSSREKILSLLQQKVILKQDVYDRTFQVFQELKQILLEIAKELQQEVKKINRNVLVEYRDKGDFEVEFTIADDTLVFLMHTNIFTFDQDHEVWKSSYVQEDRSRAYCGKIYIYNFLSDSFKYSRANDVGYLIARLFVNKDTHYFVEGKRQLGFLYNDFGSSSLDKQSLKKILESALLYSMDFDPFTPPYEQTMQISVQEVMESSLQSNIATGKRLGFRFQADTSNLGLPLP